jgi:molybdopterin molybdotransferase
MYPPFPSPDAARAAMLAAIRPVDVTETVFLQEALGRVLASDITALRDQPPFAASAMDGYALRSADTPGPLRIIGEATAGHRFSQNLTSGQAVRIFTGAPLPEGADSVLIQEDAIIDNGVLTAPDVRRGRHVRTQGIDFHEGTLLLRRGERIDPLALSLAAASGMPRLDVIRRPRVAILATGDEIVAPGRTPRPDQIFESGSFGLAALVSSWGGVARRMDAQGDNTGDIAQAIELALSTADLLVTIGGASVGDHDLVREALARFDARFIVKKIAMRPGKPTFYADTRIGPVLGLPGNPASGLVAAYLFLKPLIDQWLGLDASCKFHQARLSTPLEKNGPRETYLRAVIERIGATVYVRGAGDQDSSLISIFHKSHALIRRLPEAAAAKPGDIVDILDLGRSP